MSNVVSIVPLPKGYLTFTDSAGNATRWAIADMLRAADIPTGLTYTQVGAITSLANLVAVLIRTLIARNILDESFMEDGDYDLEAIIQTVEAMGGDYGEPDISVT